MKNNLFATSMLTATLVAAVCGSGWAQILEPIEVFDEPVVEFFEPDPFGGGPVPLPLGGDPFGTPAPAAANDDDEKETDTADPTQPTGVTAFAPPVPVEPRFVKIRLAEGSVILGKLSVDEIRVDTTFGQLTVPVDRLVSISPGLDSRSGLGDRVSQLIEDLGAEDFEVRESAQKELTKMGLPIHEELKRHRTDENAERARRVVMILGEFEKLSEEADDDGQTTVPWIRPDTVRTDSFVALGKVVQRDFTVDSQYGTITIPIGDVLEIVRPRRNFREPVAKSLAVLGTNLAQLSYKSSGIRVEKGDKIVVSATGQINRGGSSSYVSTPGGNASRFGTHQMAGQQVAGGMLLATLDGGKSIVQVGGSKTFEAEKNGTLKFGIFMRPDYVGQYQFQGKYELKIKVTPGE
jgi:hypothetical protein